MNTVVLQRHVQYRLNQLGKTGAIGLILIAVAVAAWFTLVRGGEKDLVNARKRVEAVQKQLVHKSSLPVSSSLNQEEQLRVFYKNFSPAEKVPETLQHIYKAAEKQDLVLETGEYTVVVTPGERLQRYRVGLPVKGTFKQVLSFMDKVLQDNATVALENAAFKRDKVDDAVVEAKLVFTLYVDTQP
jgi:hypothetical protein